MLIHDKRSTSLLLKPAKARAGGTLSEILEADPTLAHQETESAGDNGRKNGVPLKLSFVI